jgi:hypothetical protein
LNGVKFGQNHENKGIYVISQKYKSFYASSWITKVTFKVTKGKNVKMQVIMISHKYLQLSPKLHKIHLTKDKNIIMFELSAKL